MRSLWTVWFLFATALMPWQAQATMHWKPAPKKHSHGAHGGHDRAGKAFVLVEGEGAKVSLVDPHLKSTPLVLEGKKVVVKPTGKGNYHALVATREQIDLVESAVRYIYMHGKPPGTSPSDVTSLEKSKLELQPAPLAREHWRYYSGTEATFIVSFDGRPLPSAKVQLTTSNGSTAELVADNEGVLTVALPEDFSDVKEGRSHNKPAEFLLQTLHKEINQRYITTFSSDYHVNPGQWQSTLYGLLVMIGGMVLGLFMVKRKENA